jgi:hypothetical protein
LKPEEDLKGLDTILSFSGAVRVQQGTQEMEQLQSIPNYFTQTSLKYLWKQYRFYHACRLQHVIDSGLEVFM